MNRYNIYCFKNKNFIHNVNKQMYHLFLLSPI